MLEDQPSPHDDSHIVIISTTVGIIWTVLIFLIRLFIRLRIVGPFGLDDAAATLGTAFAAAQSAMTLLAVRNGLGEREKLIEKNTMGEARKVLDAASFFYILVVCASKCSVCLLIARLTTVKYHLRASHSVTVITAVWALTSLCSIGVLQSRAAAGPGNYQNSLMSCWLAVEVISIVLEVAIIALSVYLVWNLQMSLRMKTFVIVGFSVRIFTAVPILLRISYLWQSHPSSSPLFYGASFTVATQAAMHLSIMSATFPCMKQFLHAFNTELGCTINIKVLTDNSQPPNNNAAYQLSQMGGLRPDGPTSETLVQWLRNTTGHKLDQCSIESDRSNAAIIRKRPSWEIRYESCR